jgi:hypothetical protein
MKTLVAAALAAMIASPVLAQEADRAALPSDIAPHAATSVRQPALHPSVRNAYASAVQAPVVAGTADPDSFVRLQLYRDGLSD